MANLEYNNYNMSKYIGKSSDRWGNIIYVIGFSEDVVEFSTDLRKAILLSTDDKKIVGKILRKQYKPNIQYIKLEKFDSVTETTLNIVRDYNHHFLDDVAKFANKKDDMSLECITFAQTELNSVNTFKEFGEIVANILIEKFNLQKKEQ